VKSLTATLKALTCVTFILALSSIANAQATRTWVSGVGNDANPCSRTAPCKTFAGAITKTFIGGEIDALDAGGFGTITINKSITIDGGTSGLASILASGVSGVIVNVPVSANDPERRVTLRRLSINGTGSSGTIGLRTGLKGISVLSVSKLFVENCYIQNFTQEGLNTGSMTEAGAYISIKDTNITNCANGVNFSTSTGFIQATLDNVRLEKNTGNGVNIGVHGHVYVRNCNITFNGGEGITMANTVVDGSAHVESTFIGSNSVGIRNGGTGSVVDIANSSIFQNGTGLASASGAAGGGINSHQNNSIANNTAAGTAPNPVGQQ